MCTLWVCYTLGYCSVCCDVKREKGKQKKGHCGHDFHFNQHISGSAVLHLCVFSMIMKVSQVIILKPYGIRVIYAHHAHTGKILEAPIFYGYSKVNHSVPRVNMQDVRTLQGRLAVMLPLDTDLKSAFFGAKNEVCVWTPPYTNTSHQGVYAGGTTQSKQQGEGGREGADRNDGLEKQQTVRQASGQTDGQTEHS